MSIILIGFMGAGKTTIAKTLATQYQLPMVDTDQLLSHQYQQPTGELFTAIGEAKFREVEFQALKIALQANTPIIATGGGIIEYQKSWQLLAKQNDVFWLDVDFATCWQRIANDSNRPVAQQNSPAILLARYQNRKRRYQSAANYKITAANQSPLALASQIWALQTTLR
ncbi:shikimate kinase [Lapidilactobacillus dextrinicus]|uniref:shikimate kinase n=1 Tax=Lapidilactobacillus dextrinicus TaxID=51664 RepID=UPI003F1E8410